jgi:hypothetical protein
VRPAKLRTHLARFVLRRIVRQTATRLLVSRSLNHAHERPWRWLDGEVKHFLEELEADVAALRPKAKLEGLPSFGNRLMVEFTIYTVSADRVFRRLGVEPSLSAEIVRDLGWDIYRALLRLQSAPIRTITRDPGRRLRWTIRTLLFFPFNAPGAPGYQVQISREGPDLLTRFTHCPPESFARRLAEEADDPCVLETFKQSWCTYDWAGADVIAADGERGHYRRLHTLSHGDSECDMCWRASTCQSE